MNVTYQNRNQFISPDGVIRVPGEYDTIMPYAFYGCEGITHIILEEGVQNICSFGLYTTQAPKRIDIPNSASYISSFAFPLLYDFRAFSREDYVISCGEILSWSAPDFLERFERAHAYTLTPEKILPEHLCGDTLILPAGYTSLKLEGYDATPLKRLVVPEGVVAIESLSICGENLEHVSLPSSLMYIDSDNFTQCRNLNIIAYGDNVYTSKEEFLLHFGEKVGTCITKNNRDRFISSDGILLLTPDCTHIMESAFEGHTELRSLCIHERTVWIGKRAFANCPNLTEVVLGKGVQYEARDVFDGCSKLTSVRIPKFDPHTDAMDIAMYGRNWRSAPPTAVSLETYWKGVMREQALGVPAWG